MSRITREQVTDILREVIDPEVGINIVDLGLVYEVWTGDEYLHVNMTMTTPTCPLGSYLTDEVRSVLRRNVPDVAQVEVSLVWEPPWSPERMSEGAKSRLGWHGR